MKVRHKRKPNGAAPTPSPPPKKQHGGRRPGAGRKPAGAKAMSAGIYIRCSEEQKSALAAFVEDLNDSRAAGGLSKVELSTWIRELALKHAGREDLGLAAQARRKADAAASIV